MSQEKISDNFQNKGLGGGPGNTFGPGCERSNLGGLAGEVTVCQGELRKRKGRRVKGCGGYTSNSAQVGAGSQEKRIE